MSDEMSKVVVDGVEIEVPGDYTLLQACEEAGAEIPRFCYHERLSIAGNCRMCLVEWVGAPKPIASCAQSVKDMRPNRDGTPPEVRTSSDYVRKAREGVMEFLLINHPLDCPICDQGGECDLQDQAMAYGRSGTRYTENKRAVEDKDMGPLVKTIMTRCIQCTRCVRFVTEVAGVEEIGMINRGEDAEITTYLEKSLTSELSGNVIDLCPVGALTSKPYAFNARPWELKKTETIDVMDALGANIRVDARGPAVLRILPRVNEEINEEWISDKTRFVWDGLGRQRLDQPYIRRGGALTPASWTDALDAVAQRLKGDVDRIAAISGDLADAESQKALMDLMRALGVRHLDCRQDGASLGLDADGARSPRESYLFNTTLYRVDEADAILLVGTNPREEAAILNARLRKAWLHGDAQIGVVGEPADLTYDYAYLGGGGGALTDVATPGHMFGDILRGAERPAVIVGMGALTRSDGAQILHAMAKLAADAKMVRAPNQDDPEGWNGFNVLHAAAGRVGGLDMGFLPGDGGLDTRAIVAAAGAGQLDTVVLLGADEIDMAGLGDAFVVYIGSHGDAGAHRADVVLPAAAYTEKSGTYVNTEGRVQTGRRAVFPKGQAREDWAILRALSAKLARTLPYDSLEQLRAALISDHPTFGAMDYAPGAASAGTFDPAKIGVPGPIDGAALASSAPGFFVSNPIARASATLGQAASAVARARSEAASAAAAE